MRRVIVVRSRGKTSKRVRGRTARRRPAPRWRRPFVRYGAAAVLAVSLLGAGTWLWTSGRIAAAAAGVRDAAIASTAAVGFGLREVYVAGRTETPGEAILEALGLDSGAPLIALDTAAARARIEGLGWVREASVERRFPDTVFIRIVERRPIARWQRKGRIYLVDRDGEVIGEIASDRFAGLPVVTGKDAPLHAANLFAVVASEPLLGKRVRAAVRVGGRRWDVKLDNGVNVLLPEVGAERAWRRLAEFDRRYGLLAREMSGVDLRLPDRVVVQPPSAARSSGENT